jgi:hypothetical protein
MLQLNRATNRCLLFLFVLVCASTLLSREARAQKSTDYSADSPSETMNMPADGSSMNSEGEVAHAFFTHMGMPEGVGVYNIRLGGLVTSVDGKRDVDLAFHFETGLTKTIGFHLRNDGILDRAHTEAMFQFAAISSEDGMSGFSPIIEFEFPTHAGEDQHINTLVGFSTALAGPIASFNQVLHYNPRSDGLEGSASLVVRVGSVFFPVVELAGEVAPGEMPMYNLLGGLKFRVSDLMTLGLGLQAPLTTQRNYSWQIVFQPAIEWGKK